MSKILSKKQKEVLMQARKNGMHQGLIDIIAKAKTAAVFGKLLDMGLDPDDLEAAVKEVTGAD